MRETKTRVSSKFKPVTRVEGKTKFGAMVVWSMAGFIIRWGVKKNLELRWATTPKTAVARIGIGGVKEGSKAPEKHRSGPLQNGVLNVPRHFPIGASALEARRKSSGSLSTCNIAS